MKAIRLHRLGGPSVLKLDTVPVPSPQRGQILIEVQVASVNPVDTKIREGSFPLFKPRLPAILGRDIAGIVRAIGPANGTKKAASRFKVGDAVFGMLDYERGAYAEFTVATDRELARRPARVSPAIASTLGVAALTAWQGLFDHGHLEKNQRVLIHGAAGGVGHFAVQFAKQHGATVIATAGHNDLSWVKQLGADRVIDYKNDRFENEVGNIDLVLDLIGGETLARSWQVLKEAHGRIISTLEEPSPLEARRHRAVGKRMVVKVSSAQLTEIAELVAAKKVRGHLGKRLPLEKTATSHQLMENGHIRGKVVIVVRA